MHTSMYACMTIYTLHSEVLRLASALLGLTPAWTWLLPVFSYFPVEMEKPFLFLSHPMSRKQMARF